MRVTESEEEFRFARGRLLAGWLLTAAGVATILYFLQPIIVWGGQVAQGDPVGQLWQTVKQASAGQVCILGGLGLILVLIVVAVVNGTCGSCSSVFDKSSGQFTRLWQLGLLRHKAVYPFDQVSQIGVAYRNTGMDRDYGSCGYFVLKVYLFDGKNYDLNSSSDRKSITDLARRLQRFLNMPTDADLNVEGLQMIAKIKETKERLDALKSHPVGGMVAGMLVQQLERLETALASAGGPPPPNDASRDELLEFLRGRPEDVALHLQVAARLREQKCHLEAASVLQRAVRLMGEAAIHVADRAREADKRGIEYASGCRIQKPAVHPIEGGQMPGLWAKVLEHPEQAGNYYLVALALREQGGLPGAARACAEHAVMLRRAEGAVTAADGREMLAEFPVAGMNGKEKQVVGQMLGLREDHDAGNHPG
jgi:hypothetical protein